MAENKNENGTGKVEDATELSNSWLDDEEDDDIVEEEETVYDGSDSNYIQGYGVQTVKITMAKRITFPKSKVEFIELDFMSKDGKTLREKFMVRGKDGKTFYTKDKIKKQHFGVNKIKSLLKVTDAFNGVPAKKLMASLYGNAELADVKYEEFGKEKEEEFLVFPDLIGKKVKICITSKKENSQLNSEQDDADDQKYVKQCIKDTKKYIIANKKKRSLKKFDTDEGYVNAYRYFVVTTVSHFCSLDGLFASEIGVDDVPELMQKFIDANDEGEIFEGRTLICDDMSESQLKKLGINEYGKRVEPDEDDDDDYEEVDEDEDEEEAPKKKPKAKKESKSDDEDEAEDW